VTIKPATRFVPGIMRLRLISSGFAILTADDV
jgi:hypothetical protein